MHIQESLGSSIHSRNLESCLQCGNQNQTWFLSQLLSVDWGAGKKNKNKNKQTKKTPLPCLVPPAWTQRCGMKDQNRSRELTSYHQGNKTCLDTFPSLFRFRFVFPSPSPFLGPVDQDVEAPVFRGPTPSVQDSRLFGGNLCLPSGGCSDIPPVK